GTSAVNEFSPVGRDTVGGSGNRLLLGVCGRRGQLGTILLHLAGPEVVEPPLTRFETLDDRVPGLLEVAAAVPGGGAVTASDVATSGAETEMQLTAVHGDALMAAVFIVRHG